MAREAKESRGFAWWALILLGAPTVGWAGSEAYPPDRSRGDEPAPIPVPAVAFEANLGQYPAEVRFAARAGGATTFLTDKGALSIFGTEAVLLGAHGATGAHRPRGEEPLPGTVNHLRGSDPAGWVTGAPTYAKVRYPGVYPGIDLVFYGAAGGGEIEYDFVVAPGADPRAIALAFEGHVAVRIDETGDLVLDVGGQELRHRAPVAFQERDGARQPVEARFVPASDGRIAFEVGAYDPGKTLVIDPVLSWATYLGSNGHDVTNGVVADASGSLYVVGYTTSPTFPLLHPLDSTLALADVTLTKYDVEGRLVFSTLIGGADNDYGQGIALGPDGNVYLTGHMQSADFPAKKPLKPFEGFMDAFITAVDPDGTTITFSTPVGGKGADYGRAIAVGDDGVVYVAGMGNEAGEVDYDVLVAAVDPSEPKLIYLKHLKGAEHDEAFGIDVDAAGRAHVVGATESANFPVKDPLQGHGGGRDAFVVVLSPQGDLEFSTPFGGTGYDEARGVAVDSGGSTYFTGMAQIASGIRLVDPIWSTGSGFVARLDPGFNLTFSTRSAGQGDWGRAIQLGPDGRIVVAGDTTAKNLPAMRAVQGPNSGMMGFLLQLEDGGPTVRSLTHVGGSGTRKVTGLALDSEGGATVVGYIHGEVIKMPTWTPVKQNPPGGADGFVIRVAECVTDEPADVLLDGSRGNSGWWRVMFFVTLRARCPVDGFISLDGAPEARAMAARNLHDGERSVTLRTVRLDGSEEAPRTLHLKVDGRRPDLSVLRDCPVPGKGSWCYTDLHVEVSATDSLSGMSRLDCAVGGSARKVPCARHDVTGDGRHSYSYTAEDVAGNVAIRTGYHEIDGTPPEGVVQVSCTDWGKAKWCRGTARVDFDVLDRTSGVERSTCSVGDIVVSTCAKGFVETGHEGVHEALLSAEDFAGNVLKIREPVKIDLTPPTVRLTEPGEGDATVYEHRDPLEAPLPFTVVAGGKVLRSEASDALSGVERVEFFVDGVLVGTDYEAPYEHAWDASRESLGEHRLLVRAFDFAEHSAQQERVVFVVPLPPPPGVPAVPG